MGRRAKDKQLVAQASRRRTVLQIERVSRRETAEVPSSSGQTRAINPTSITGIGLLGSYGDHSDDEEGEGDYEGSIDQNGAPVLGEESTVASTSSTGPHSEIDAKLADFFNEIASMDADTTTVTDERDRNRLAEEAVSSTTEEELPVTSVAEGGYEQGEDYTGNEGDMYPWQACLDETTNCYYYWNVETNEVQWEPPQQLLAVTDTQTTDSNQDIDGADNSEYYKEKEEEEVHEEQVYQGDENFDTNKDMDSEEKQDNASESDGKEANSKSSSDNELDGFELVDSWEDQGQEEAEVPADKKASTRKSEVGVSDEEVPAKKPKLVEAESDDSDDDFAAQLLEDTYEKGKQDVVSEQIMDLSEENNEKIETKDKQKDEETDADKPLLPPEVFKHLKKAETAERKEEKPVMDEQEPKYDAIEEDYRMQIIELTSVLSNKLDFLEVSRKGVSSLKVLLIELETRISDWREGALDSRHFIHKLCEADKQLKQYEESAAPPGWTCHWDRYCISLVFCQGG